MRDYSDILYGNKELVEMLISDAVKGGLLHAYIIEGEHGSGKKTLAYLAAKTLACKDQTGACLKCETCRRIDDGLCPDIIFTECPKNRKTIGVDTVRKIKESAYITSNELDFKFFMICDAHLMTVEAQNAFLKVLEEPPKNVYFFLLCDNISSILPTVRSRAPVLRMQKFSFAEMSEYIRAREPKAEELYKSSRDDFDFSVRSASGSIGALRERFSSSNNDGAAKKYELVKGITESLCHNSRADFLMSCIKLSDSREELGEIYECTAAALRDIMYVKSSEKDDLMFYTDVKEAAAFADKYTFSDIIKLTDICMHSRAELESNVNVSTSAIKFAIEMWDAKN